MFRTFHFFLTLFFIVIMTRWMSNNRQHIQLQFIIQLLFFEILFAYFLLHSKIGHNFIIKFSAMFYQIITFSAEGTNFVFGNMNRQGLAFFFLNVLCPMVLVSSIIGILQYIRILPILIYSIGTVLSKVNGIGKLDSFNTISSLILGQSENFIVYKNILGKISEHRICSMAIAAMSTVSVSIVGSYMTVMQPKYVVTAIVLNIFSTFIVLSLLNPYQIDNKEDFQIISISEKNSFFEMLVEHIISGFKVAIIVSAMLIGFISLISAGNALFIMIFGISLQKTIGYFLFPFAWGIGIPISESLQAGCVMATKLISNEFIAMMDLQKISESLSQRTVCIISIFLVSFANFSSIGIISGAIKGLNKEQGSVISRHGIKILFSSTLVSLLSAAVTEIVI